MKRVRSSLAALMCLTICLPSMPVPAQSTPQSATHQTKPAPRVPYRSDQLEGDQRILHALNRFTFGPRPGDLNAVRAAGLDQWFEAQLRPAAIDERDLDARLAQYPAMQWSAEDLLFRLPNDAMVRQAMDGKAPFPEHGALHAVYANELARYQFKKEEKEKKQQAAAAPADATMNAGAVQMNARKPALPTAQGDEEPGQLNAPMAPLAELPAADESDIARILALPPAERVARLTTMRQPEFDSLRKAMKPAQKAALTADLAPDLKETVAALENPPRLVVEELAAQRLARDIYSNAQLQEVMTDFWMNHFNVFLHKNPETPYYLVSYERDVIRLHALGKFEDLLEATAHSPAMMLYLDNATSIGPDSQAAERAAQRPDNKKKAHEGLNENYARELMELHTLGVNGGYTQADVTQVARVFTGWTVDRPARGGQFEFDAKRHEPGAKKVLGKKIKEHGELEGRQVLHMLASSPATARFISRKLAIRFVSDNPPQSIVDRLAKSYMSSGGDIAAVLRTLFHSPEFWSADDYRVKVKTPIEFVTSAVRACACEVTNYQPLTNALQGMGMPLYGSVPPTGYNWQSSTWVSTGALVNRMNFALALAANKFNGVSASWDGNANLILDAPTAFTVGDSQGSRAAEAMPTPAGEEHRLEAMLVPGGVSESTRSAVLRQFAAQGAPDTTSSAITPVARKPFRPAANAQERQDEALAGLLLGSPEFQRR